VIRTTPQDITDPESDFDHQLEDETPEHELPDLINGVAERPAIYGPTSGNGSGEFEEDDENKNPEVPRQWRHR
jgi:type I restriction enzyme R subunit